MALSYRTRKRLSLLILLVGLLGGAGAGYRACTEFVASQITSSRLPHTPAYRMPSRATTDCASPVRTVLK